MKENVKDNLKIGLLIILVIGTIISMFYLENTKTRKNEIEIEKLQLQLKELQDTRPTFDEVDTISQNNSGGIVYLDRNDFTDKQPNVDLSQPATPPKPKQKDVTYTINATGKSVVAGDETCGIDENRLHWELFGVPAPGCENTPHKGLR